MDLLHWAAITQSVFLAIYFLRSRPGFQLQSCLLFITALGIFHGYLYSSQRILEVPALARVGFSLIALTGPLILFATFSQLKEKLSARLIILPLLVPFGILVYLLPFYLSSAADKLAYLKADLVQIHLDCVIILYAASCNNLICLLISLKRLSGQKDRLPRIFYLGILAVILIPFFLSLLDPNLLNSGLFSGVVSVLVLARSWQIVYRAESGKLASFLLLARADAYRKSALSGERMEAVAAKIKLAVQSNDWMDPDYSLRDLAKQTGESVDVLSQVFSQHLDLSYSTYITGLRLEAARRMLADPAFAEFSVLRIGFEAGFNSRSAFHEAFKRSTGGTPAEFRKKSKSN